MKTTDDRINDFMDTVGEYVNSELVNYLVENGFFTAPASAGHHGNYEGALFDHSFSVMEELLDMSYELSLEWEKLRSPYIVGMFHDICKIDSYIKTEDGYIYNKEAMPGHGDKSVIILKQFIELTEEEFLCIRWHMGAFDKETNWQRYSKSVRKYPNVLFTHTADMIASQVRGI